MKRFLASTSLLAFVVLGDPGLLLAGATETYKGMSNKKCKKVAEELKRFRAVNVPLVE